MFDFRLFSQRTVRVRLRDGSTFTASFRVIIPDGWCEPKPTLWLSDWSLEHLVPLDSIQSLEAA